MLAVAAALVYLYPMLQWVSPQRASRRLLHTLALATIGYVVAKLHLLVFNPLFLRRGRLARLLKKKA